MQDWAQVAGDDSVPLVEQSIGAYFGEVARRHPRAEALVDRDSGVRYTFEALRQAVERLAAGLYGAGARRGDRVAMWSPNRAESVLVELAAARIGAVLVGINPDCTQDELGYVLGHCAPVLVLAAPGHRGADYAAMLTAARGGRWAGDFVILDSPAWTALTEPGGAVVEAAGRAAAEVGPDDPFCLQYTSGTTGRPKAAVISHRAALNDALFIGRTMRLSPDDRLCACLPFFHAFGIVACVLATLAHGGTVVVSGPRFSAGAVLRTVQEEACTVLHGVPMMFILELAHEDFGSYDLSSLRTGLMGGAQCPLEVVGRVKRDMHMRELTVGFGMSETTSVTTQTSPADPVERQVETVGRVHPHMEAAILDIEGKVVRVGEVGELVVRGYARMLGYWDDPDETARVIDAEGWLHTGDLATIDVDGFVSVVGRLKDMIIRGGENIYPREIEDELYRVPGVVEACVVGVPDRVYGECVVAAVRVAPGRALGPDDVIAHCRENLARHKVPQTVVIREDFPVTASGKIRRNVLREELAAELPSA
ncbi:AMP-binding protein [Streptomyces tendae]